MENNNNYRDFEQFVKQNADQYRMFPSENVWKGIHNTLHTRRRWYSIGFGILLLTTGAAVSSVMLSSSGKNEKPAIGQPAIAHHNLVLVDKKTQNPHALISSSPAVKTHILFLAAADVRQNKLYSLDEIPGNLPGHKDDVLTAVVVQNETNPIDKVDPVMKKEVAVHSPINIQITDQAFDNNSYEDLTRNDQVAVTENKETGNKEVSPLSIESVVNSYKYKAIRKRISWQVYFLPTISYRKLTENAAFLRSPQSNNSPYSYAALNDVNNAVTHKPNMGFQIGFSTGYPLIKNLTLIAGLQFNVSKYDILAYPYTSEMATIALSNGPGINSVSTLSNYRNFGGYSSNWLHNLYLSVSVPIGAELKLSGTDKMYLGVGGTIQPTYILRDRAYLISTDYKNYAEVPSLIRKWNVNSGFEIFAGYITGKLKWKVGPQVRYQMLSSFQEKYPVREHLFDFGLKVGIMLNK